MRSARHILLLAAALALLAPAAAQARRPAPHLSWVKCYRLCSGKHTVAPGGTVKLGGRRFSSRMRVIFRASTKSRKRTIKAQRVGSTRLLARVPATARKGRIYATAPHGLRTNAVGPIKIRKKKATRPSGGSASPTGTAFDGDAMWIWNLAKSQGGDPAAIVQQARAHGIETVFVKSGDGTNYWTQFSPELVGALKAGGLHVCGWQYVYGTNPAAEAAVAARAATTGAECFVIDAEKEYEGRYQQAQQYVRALRQAVGADYPIGLSSFPYVDYHPGLPYSEFLAPGAAQFNLPQAYWKTIGDSVDDSLEHTFRFNRPYERAIAPAGQSYNAPPPEEIVRFRQLSAALKAPGVSWWAWESTADPAWNAIGQPLDPFTGPPPATDYAPISRGAKGDLVVWAQEHLQSAGQAVTVDGDFGPATETAVRNFQAANGLAASGVVDTATWQALTSKYDPAPQTWTGSGPTAAAAGAPTGPAKSAGLPAKRYEIPRSPGG